MSFAEAFQKEMFALKSKAEKAMIFVGKQIKLDTVDFIPVASGQLRNSYVFDIEKDANGLTLVVGYASDHAVKQHEETLNHVSHAPITKSFQEFAGGGLVGYGGKLYWKGYWIAIQNKTFERFPAKFLEKSLNANKEMYIDIIREVMNG